MSIGHKLRFQVLTRDNYTCRYCGAFAPVVKLVLDHVVPKSKRGADILENLVTACEECNSGKSATMPAPGTLASIEELSAQFLRMENGEPDEDDLYEMEAYQDSVNKLASLPADEVLHWIEQAYIAAAPYRPAHSELINCAAGMLTRQRRSHPVGN